MLDHLIDDPIFLGLNRRHDPVALDVSFNLFDRLACVMRKDLIEIQRILMISSAAILISVACPEIPPADG